MEENKEKQKLDLNKLEAKEGVLKIIHESLPRPHLEKLHEEQPVKLKGTIKAPANFYQKRTAEIDNKKTHIKYSYRDRKITLVTIEDYTELGSEIEGSLIINPEFSLFGVNTDKMFTVNELVKHVRMSKYLFESKEHHAKILASLKTFTAKVETEIKKINDNRGNIEEVYKVTMTSNAELNFNLLAPVFIGEEAKSINVEISCQADNNQVKFWFESVDFINLLKQDSKTIIDSELGRFSEEVVFIEQ